MSQNIALVWHSPGVLSRVKYQGEPLVKGMNVICFTNREDEEVKLTTVVPFLVVNELLRLAAIYESGMHDRERRRKIE